MTRDNADRIAAVREQARLFPQRRSLPTLPDICVELRMACNGSSAAWPANSLAEVVAMLRRRLATWYPSAEVFDELVRSLVALAVEMGEQELADRIN